MHLHPLTAYDIIPGSPLPWPVYDADGHLMFERGVTLAAGYPLETLYRSADDGATTDPAQVAEFSATERIEEAPGSEMFPPNGIKPQMWEIVQIRRLERDTKRQYFSRLIGYIWDASVLVTIPLEHAQHVLMIEGEHVEIRMLIGCNIYVFRAQIIRLALLPSPYMHLSFPRKIQRQHLRKAPWGRINLIATIERPNQETSSGFITNISNAGTQLYASDMLGGEGQVLRLLFHVDIDGLKKDLSLQAVVRHMRKIVLNRETDPTLIEYGVEFVDPGEDDVLWLKCLVYQRIAMGYMA
ncbi:MAG: flagellar brake protein [Sulfuricellaceae bacterium]